MVLNSYSYLSLGLMLVGVIALIIGVTLYEVNVGTKESRSPWIWTLIIGGGILSFAASIFSIILLNKPEPMDPSYNYEPYSY